MPTKKKTYKLTCPSCYRVYKTDSKWMRVITCKCGYDGKALVERND